MFILHFKKTWRFIWKFQPRRGIPCKLLTVQYVFWREKTAVGEPGRAGGGDRATHRSLTLKIAGAPGSSRPLPPLSVLLMGEMVC